MVDERGRGIFETEQDYLEIAPATRATISSFLFHYPIMSWNGKNAATPSPCTATSTQGPTNNGRNRSAAFFDTTWALTQTATHP